jgi:hypothetical protein
VKEKDIRLLCPKAVLFKSLYNTTSEVDEWTSTGSNLQA